MQDLQSNILFLSYCEEVETQHKKNNRSRKEEITRNFFVNMTKICEYSQTSEKHQLRKGYYEYWVRRNQSIPTLILNIN